MRRTDAHLPFFTAAASCCVGNMMLDGLLSIYNSLDSYTHVAGCMMQQQNSMAQWLNRLHATAQR